MSAENRPGRLDRFASAMDGWRFPVVSLSLLLGITAAMLMLLLIPRAPTGLGAFAADFRVWCFGYNPETGDVQWSYLGSLLFRAGLLAGIVTLGWWQPLCDALRDRPREVLTSAGLTQLAVLFLAGLLPLLATPTAGADDLSFPAESIRTSHRPPSFDLTSQDGIAISPERMKGKVIVLTAVYASCGFTCPMILGQAKRVAAQLTDQERADLRIIGITLDPERDTPKVLAGMAKGQEVHAPLFNLVTGEPAEVNRVLDALQVARSRDPDTGVLDHANVFAVIDRSGRLAYRFSLGDRQEQWLTEALRLLLGEK